MRVYSGLCSALIRDVGAREADVSQISSRLGEERVTMYSSGRPGCGHSWRRLRCRRLLSGLPQLGGNVNWMWSSDDGELNGFTRQSRLGEWCALVKDKLTGPDNDILEPVSHLVQGVLWKFEK